MTHAAKTSTQAPRTSTHGKRGFTMVEILIASVIAISASLAVLTLQTASINGTSNSRDMSLALNLAEHLLSSIQAEAILWTDTRPTGSMPTYLKNLPEPFIVDTSSGWMSAWPQMAEEQRTGSMGGDDQTSASPDLGVLQEIPKTRGARFCSQYRLTWLRADLVRAEARVMWAYRGADVDKYKECPIAMAGDVGRVGTVTLPTTVMKNVFVR